MRFFLIDRVTDIVLNETITGIKAWSLDNEIFTDHFPGHPIVPGVLLTESMAQLFGLLVERSYYENWGDKLKVFPLLSIIQKAKFRSVIEPGDQTILKAKLISLDKRRAVGKVDLFVEGELKAEATLSFSIATIEEIGPSRFLERREEFIQIVFKGIE